VFDVPSITDYEPQTSQRFAELSAYLWHDAPMQSLNEYLMPLTFAPRSLPILDLLATRFLLVARDADRMNPFIEATFRFLAEVDGVRIYENPNALPRAYYVPEVRAVGTTDLLLHSLALASVNPRRAALIDGLQAPAGGTPNDPTAMGDVAVVQDRSETVMLAVRATADGFVVLTDQYYPGWEATVNGAPVPIHRVNYAFRAVPVPAGASTVVFRYRPRALYAGAAISAASSLVVVAIALVVWRRRGEGRSFAAPIMAASRSSVV